MYSITAYTFAKAKQYGLVVRPSSFKHKKIDVYREGFKIGSVGDDRYSDYPTMASTDPQYAEKRRQLYHKRHKPELSAKYSPNWLAGHLLW